MKIEKYKPKIFYYRIKATDTKNNLADKFNTKIENIKNYSKNCEDVGDFYLISKINSKTHIVKPLENLNLISKKYNISEEEIIKNNNLKTKTLFIGQKLYF